MEPFWSQDLLALEPSLPRPPRSTCLALNTREPSVGATGLLPATTQKVLDCLFRFCRRPGSGLELLIDHVGRYTGRKDLQ